MEDYVGKENNVIMTLIMQRFPFTLAYCHSSHSSRNGKFSVRPNTALRCWYASSRGWWNAYGGGRVVTPIGEWRSESREGAQELEKT